MLDQRRGRFVKPAEDDLVETGLSLTILTSGVPLSGMERFNNLNAPEGSFMILIIWFLASILAVLLFYRKRVAPTVLGVVLTFSLVMGIGWLSILFLRADTILAALIGLAVALLFVRLLLAPTLSTAQSR